MSIFTGAGVALITPFHEDGSVNYTKLTEILEEQIAGGTDSIIICGTTGEASTLSHEEHIEVIRYTCEVVNHRIPVIAGTGSNCTETACYLSKEAERVGADGLLLVSPYYNKATQKGLIAHFGTIAQSVHIPILLYNIPSRTGVTIQPQTIVTLVKEYKNIVGVKEASGNFSAIAQMMALAKEQLNGEIDVYSGNDDQVVPLLALGGKGVISVLSNIAPAQVHEMCDSYFRGETTKSTQMQVEAIPLINALFCEVNPIPVKAAMNLMGKETGPLRMPLTTMEEDNQKVLKKAMEAYGLL
ncbi:MAG: 4-hydroxy-tetrahydrodipicolinate synthase [bacterium]|nr:4-hydroxy-tetrahydrodipicolinate synthase [bacterium]